jgi:uncharacterized DUF497 family protein
MKITFDPAKDRINRNKHGLPLAAAEHLFHQPTIQFEDDRFDYGEARMVALGLIEGRVVVCVYVDRGDTRRIISLRKATKHETTEYFHFAHGR